MCGRYLYFDQNNKVISSMLQQLQMNFSSQEISSLSLEEIFPSQKTVVCVLDENKKWFAKPMHWGISLPHKKGLVINARSETAATSSLFAHSLKSRRCLVLASGYYEWDKNKKEKFLFQSPNQTPLFLAGFYQQTDSSDHFVIMTKEAQPEINSIHSRMPVLFTRNQAQDYLINGNHSNQNIELTWHKVHA